MRVLALCCALMFSLPAIKMPERLRGLEMEKLLRPECRISEKGQMDLIWPGIFLLIYCRVIHSLLRSLP
jgi:hypothetical protein